MANYVAFLRAINVGGHTVKMDRLRDLFASLGFSNVQTFIASGNVVFEAHGRSAPALERKIEKHLLASLGYEVKTFVRSRSELSAIAQHQPYSEMEVSANDASLYVAFLQIEPAPESVEKLMGSRTDTDDFVVHGREVYWLCRTRFSESSFSGALLEKTLKLPATIRNATTVRKLAAKHCGDT
jgi:uncharacterized protein (DUF1697 family)